MASDASSHAPRTPMTASELISFVKRELDADEERQAKVTTASPGDLPTGSTLDLSHKNISALPVEVVILIKDKVERLALSHNPRIAIPSEIVQCDKLRYLNLRWNKLRHFPEAVLSLSKLEILDISKNAIDAVPEDIKKMTNLKFLAVAKNQIRRLPLALGEMNLVKLKFDENPIEFPPMDALKPAPDRTGSVIESEKDKDMCQQVKRFMKATALRERLRTNSEEELSESSVETPRPPKRGVTGGRFPVRPSISSMDSLTGSKSESPPNQPPPIPQRSHARVASNNIVPPTKRPGVAPLLTGGLDNNRSRSETVATSANVRSRRQGYVPRKHSNLNSYSEMSSQLSARSSQAAALTPPHSRGPSATSSYANFLAVGNGGDGSQVTLSPMEGPVNRTMLSRTLASLPESRNSRLPTVNSLRAAKRVLFMLFYLYTPVRHIAQEIGRGSPRKSPIERNLHIANAHVEELDRLVNNANSVVEDNAEIEPILLMSIMRTTIVALKSYGSVVKEMQRSCQQATKHIDAFHVRCMINTAYSTTIEARNVCNLLGIQIKDVSVRDTLRASKAWSSRTVTPTQPKSANSTRRRGATVLPRSGSITNMRGAPPVPLHNGSRSNTLTSLSSMTAATPRYNESFTSLASHSNGPSRSNTMRSITTEDENEDNPDNVYLKLKACCDLATRTLPPVRDDLWKRKTEADSKVQSHASSLYNQAVEKCDVVIASNGRLVARLKVVKVGDLSRYQKEFSQMTESFARDWHHFVKAIVEIKEQRIDIGNNRTILKPLQHAVKEANRAAAQFLPSRPPPSGSAHGFTTSANMTSHVPPPATPLGAALGPAVQATVPPTPATALNSAEYFPSNPHFERVIPARNNSTLPPPSYTRR